MVTVTKIKKLSKVKKTHFLFFLNIFRNSFSDYITALIKRNQNIGATDFGCSSVLVTCLLKFKNDQCLKIKIKVKI